MSEQSNPQALVVKRQIKNIRLFSEKCFQLSQVGKRSGTCSHILLRICPIGGFPLRHFFSCEFHSFVQMISWLELIRNLFNFHKRMSLCVKKVAFSGRTPYKVHQFLQGGTVSECRELLIKTEGYVYYVIFRLPSSFVFEHHKHFFRFDRRLIRPHEFSTSFFQVSSINILCSFSYRLLKAY